MQVGIDNIEIERLKDIEKNDTKLEHLFTKNEIEYFNKFKNRVEHIAGFFCAKEAFAKALKSGFGKKLSVLDFEILHETSGAPFINLLSLDLKEKLKDSKIELSISHSDTMATAVCVIY